LTPRFEDGPELPGEVGEFRGVVRQ
jgi:hypothetical protein